MIQILLKVFIVLQCQDGKLTVSGICPTNLYFKQNKPMKLEIFTFLSPQRKFIHFWGAELETTIHIVLRLLIALPCQDNKLLSSKQFTFYTNPTNRIWNFGVFACSKEIHPIFLGGAELENKIQIVLKLFIALQCQDNKMLFQFFAQAIYLLDKTNRWNLKFWPFHLLEEISLFSCMLNWKPQFRFCYKISMTRWLVFSKRYISSTKNCGRSFILWHWKAH